MSYQVINSININANELLQENIALKKEISVLELSEKQLLRDVEIYKIAYERYANNILVKFIKKILGKQK